MHRTILALVAAAVLIVPSAADAKHRHHHRHHVIDANGGKAQKTGVKYSRHVSKDAAPEAGTVVSHKTGATARVGVAYAARFQAYIDDLENEYGARVTFMGGIRPGHCSSASEHPCGKALDVCQLRRGVVHPGCHLPSRKAIALIAAKHGLFEGGQWCHHDYGHAQVDVSAPACGERTLMARAKVRQSRRMMYAHAIAPAQIPRWNAP